MRKGKIAFVGNSSFSMYNFRLGVMKSFFSDGYEVFVVAPFDDYSFLFESEGLKYIQIDIDCKGKNPIRDFLLFVEFYKKYKKENFDFVFHYTIKPVIYGSIACSILNKPSIAITTGLGYTFNKEGFTNKIVRSLYKVALKKVKSVCFLNKNDQELFVAMKIVPQNKTFILPSEGIDIAYFQPRKKEQNKTFVFLLLSRLLKDKGVCEYVKAAKILREKHPSIEFWLLGKSDNENPENIPINTVSDWHEKGYINFLGDSKDVRLFIAQSDCVVLPSYYREGVPRCLMEAMSMERPIITTDNVGCVDLILDHVNGLLCKQKDPFDLALKMEQMYLLSSVERLKMGISGRKLIEKKYVETKIIKLYQKLFQTYFS